MNRLAAVLLFAAAGHYSPSAAACSCIPFNHVELAFGPAQETTPDGLIWLWTQKDDASRSTPLDVVDDILLIAPSGAEIGVTSRVLSDGLALQPDDTLQVGLEYQAVSPVFDDLLGLTDTIELGTVTVAASVPAPIPPTVSRVQAFSGIDSLPGFNIIFSNSCTSSLVGTVNASFYLETDDPFAVVSTDPDPPEPDFPWDTRIERGSLDKILSIGNLGPCRGGVSPLPLSQMDVRFGAFSTDGTFSGWSEPTTVRFPPPGCSCASQHVPRAGFPFFGFVVILLATRVVRRPIENSC